MKRAMNYVRGTVTLTARGLFPERLLNLCAQEGAPCWGVEWRDDHTLRLTTFRHKLSLVKKLAQRAGCEISVEGRRGLPDFLGRFRRRYNLSHRAGPLPAGGVRPVQVCAHHRRDRQ